MNILILTGEFGKGHISVAKAVKENIQESYADSNIVVCDLVHYLFPRSAAGIYKVFNRVARTHHNLYNIFSKASEKPLNSLCKNFMVQKLSRMVNEYQPDLIVSTIPLGSQYISDYKSHTGSDIPLITYITDIYVQNEWICDQTDLYVAGSEITRDQLAEKGISEDKIIINGIPVQNKFKEKTAIASRTKKKVLIMGGGLGIIDSIDEMITAINKSSDAEITVVTGNNKKLYKKISTDYPQVKVYRFTDKVATLMKENDLLITKAGGITLFESLYSEIPMFVTKPFFNQEIGNAKFIESTGMGKVLWNSSDRIEDEVCDLLRDDERIGLMKRNINRLRQKLDNCGFEDVLCRLGEAK